MPNVIIIMQQSNCYAKYLDRIKYIDSIVDSDTLLYKITISKYITHLLRN